MNQSNQKSKKSEIKIEIFDYHFTVSAVNAKDLSLETHFSDVTESKGMYSFLLLYISSSSSSKAVKLWSKEFSVNFF